MKSILDPSFKYTPAHETDIRKTFDRIRANQAKAAEGAPKTVVPIVKKGKQ
jgi:hypothetical protein